jgi:DNA recombination protein RmuC
MSEILLIVIGVVLLGAIFIVYHLLKPKGTGTADTNALETEKRVLEERVRMMEDQLADQKALTAEKEKLVVGLNGEIAGKDAELKALNEKYAEHRAEVEKLQEKFKAEFKNLANEILEEKTQKFTEQNSTRMNDILKPLGEKIRDFEKKVEEAYDKESKQRFSLEKEIQRLAEMNQQISLEASNLTKALKGQAKTQGNWGEMILESILEKSGLVRDREYFVQSSFTNEHGRRLQPDVIIAYPGERSVVVDAKVSLNAYERYSSAESKEEQEIAAREHLLSVKNHINELSGKNYQDLYQLKTLDFVMLFMPVEPAYMLAMQQEPSLWSTAYDKRILLISPTNLIAAVRMIANLWRVEYQNKNAQEIARQSGDLFDKFVNFVDDLTDIGKKIEASQQSYESAHNKLVSGKGNLVRRAEKIRELGAKTSKEIPKAITDKLDDEET